MDKRNLCKSGDRSMKLKVTLLHWKLSSRNWNHPPPCYLESPSGNAVISQLCSINILKNIYCLSFAQICNGKPACESVSQHASAEAAK